VTDTIVLTFWRFAAEIMLIISGGMLVIWRNQGLHDLRLGQHDFYLKQIQDNFAQVDEKLHEIREDVRTLMVGGKDR